jgi:hypothetical protein
VEHKILYPRGVALIFQGRFLNANVELLHAAIERLSMNEQDDHEQIIPIKNKFSNNSYENFPPLVFLDFVPHL